MRPFGRRVGAIEKSSGRGGHLSFSGLAPGLYKLYETKAPEGYEIPKDKDGKPIAMSVFSVNEDGEITKMDPADGKLVNGRGEGRFSIHKTNNAENEEDRKPLKGAEFTLTPLKEDGTPDTTKAVVKTTDENGDLTFSGLPLGKYQLKETKPAPGYLLRDTTWTVVVEEKAIDPNHPEIKGVVTTVTEDKPGAKEAPMAQSLKGQGAAMLSAKGPVGLPTSPLSKLTARFAKTAAPASATPLRSPGEGKYQYKNPVEVDGTKWPKDIQEVDANDDGQADYKITQTMAPVGYRKLDAPIRLRYTIPADPATEGRRVEQIDEKDPTEVLATLYEEEIIDEVWTPKYGINYKPYKIVDEHSVFPYTAGPGTVLFAIAGAFLMTAAIALGGLARKKEKL